MLAEILQRVDTTELVIAIALAMLSALLVWYKKQLIEWKNFWHGVLDGLRSIPGLQTDVAELKQDLQGIRKFVAPNGDGSLMAAAARTEIAVQALIEQVELIGHTIRAKDDSDEGTARFDCDENGGHTYINLTFARWLGVGKPELLGWNYMNYVHPNDIAKVKELWDLCRAQHRQYRNTYRMVDIDGAVFTVHSVATPIPDGPPIKRWVGVMRKVPDGQTVEKIWA